MSGSLSQKVAMLESDLRAVIVIQEEKRHWEDETHIGSGASDAAINKAYAKGEIYEAGWVIDQPRITEPNTLARISARDELERIYNSLSWYDFLLKRKIKKSLRSA